MLMCLPLHIHMHMHLLAPTAARCQAWQQPLHSGLNSTAHSKSKSQLQCKSKSESQLCMHELSPWLHLEVKVHDKP